jgi:acyl carrier protein
MTALWAEVLEIARDKINVKSNFFSLGGDSLRALKLVKAINDKYSVNLRLSEVIADPATPNSVLESIEKHRSKGKFS